MNFSDILSITQWWLMFFLIGIIFLPFTLLLFNKFFDKGYIFSKIIGVVFISYTGFVLGFLQLLPFQTYNLFLIVGIFILVNFFIVKKFALFNVKFKSMLPIFILEEFIFILILLLWSFIHAHQPQIHGLEKYMDFGFINSILRAEYFPPKDMWFTPFYINYYYFGHLATATLTKLSFLPSYITFNLVLSTISALSFVAAFSIGANLIHACIKKTFVVLLGGLIAGLILNFSGNLQVIYTFFKPYANEYPVPFWQLIFSPSTFPNGYWYPNATRFIENTIHEFPLYSYVVSDLHGHVLDIPFVLLTIAVLLSLLLDLKIKNLKLKIPLISFLLAIMYMTNAWDGLIYFLLTAIVILVKQWRNVNKKIFNNWVIDLFIRLFVYLLIISVGFFLFSLPFNLNFKPFASGIGILCAPEFLTNIEKLGPLIFEKDHCQRSPWWQLIILHGFFYFWVISFGVFLLRFVILSRIRFGEGYRKILRFAQNDITSSDIFILILILLSTLLIIIPEFIYVKDIYPAHYRANTMFKLAYQSFIMLSLASGYIILRIFTNLKSHPEQSRRTNFKFVYWFIGSTCLLVVFLYPYFAVNSYFGDLKKYSGLNGTNYLKTLYYNDYEAISWINKNIKNQPIILEAQGDSYTDYGRVSANTGLPTVLGWTVHEWLWRGTYDIPAPRIPEVQKMYESENLEETKSLLKRYNVSLVFFGDLERQKYQNLNEDKFKTLGKVIYENGKTKIYQIN